MFYAHHKWMLLICFFVHFVFLISIFDIYFKSPIVKGVPSLKNEIKAPAKRLALVIGDGLRADSFFKACNDSKSIPHLREVIEQRGTWGVSHTRVPTESRPGHVAILGGFYEDPSAIFKGWKDNPIDFDSVINQSDYTFGYGSPDILSIFSKEKIKDDPKPYDYLYKFNYHEEKKEIQRIRMESYPESFEELSSGQQVAKSLSLWSYDKFTDYMRSNKYYPPQELNSSRTIFFLHLLGIDTAGHSDKPHSRAYLKNIELSDDIVHFTELCIREFYKDNDTAFIFTSDHGMTDWGSHGEGSVDETETPFVAWGAGIKKPKKSNHTNTPYHWYLNHINRNDLRQADIAPLISILLGIPIPVNSVGVLPLDYLDMSDEDKSAAILLNARQILAQYNKKRELVEATTLNILYTPFEKLSDGRDVEIVNMLQEKLEKFYYKEVIRGSLDLISLCLSGLDYYHNYYQRLLLFCIAFSYIGWMVWLFLNVLSEEEHKHTCVNSRSNEIEKLKNNRLFALHVISLILMFVTGSLLYLQTLPLQYYLYCNLPLVIWWNVIRRIISSYSTTNHERFSGSLLITVFLTILGTEIVILSFFQRRLLSVVVVGLAVWLPWYKQKIKLTILLSVLWIFSCLILAIFPFLPIIGGKPNNTYLILNALIWCLLLGICWFITTHMEIDRKTRRKAIKMFILYVVLFGVAACNVVYVTYAHGVSKPLNQLNQIISWIILLTVPIFPFVISRLLLLRLLSIYFSLGVVSLLFSNNHDALFLPIFSLHLFLWMLMENSITNENEDDIELLEIKFQSQNAENESRLKSSDFRRAFLYFFYTVFSFFGTGNIASINSFDTLWVRCFVTVFAPFTMMTLILVKTVIPFFVTACTFRAINEIFFARADKMFLIVMLYCDLLGLNFLFFVKNVGSWLQIGESVSHYVISQTIIMFLVLLYFLSGLLTAGKCKSLKKFFIGVKHSFRPSSHVD